MNTQNNITSHETHEHKVLFKPQGILGFIYSVLPNGAILKFEKTGTYACACFDNLIDFNEFKSKLSLVQRI